MFRFLTYNKFKLKKWKKLSFAKRLEVYQKLENIEAKINNRNPNTIIVENLDNANGIYYENKNIIKIDIKFILKDEFRFLGMYVIFHEGRHSFQAKAVSKPRLSVFSQAYRWKKNMEGYLDTTEDKYSFYTMQPIERDANAYALKRLKKFSSRFASQTEYERTVKIMEDNFIENKLNAKKELGIFYKFKISLKSNKKRNKK